MYQPIVKTNPQYAESTTSKGWQYYCKWEPNPPPAKNFYACRLLQVKNLYNHPELRQLVNTQIYYQHYIIPSKRNIFNITIFLLSIIILSISFICVYIFQSIYIFSYFLFFQFIVLFPMTSEQSDGWDSAQQIQIIDLQQHSFIKFKGEKALNLINSNYYSLEPDMVSGWKPKLPSCPLPLSYKNTYIDSLKNLLIKKDNYEIIYIGHRFSNSVQVNKNYQYSWKYRQKYEMNIDVVQDAIIKVGNQQKEYDVDTDVKRRHRYIFDSKFQSGNLDLVVKVKNNEYDCFIRSDTNTRGHSNWYYFNVQNLQNIGPVKINICNMTKCKNLYSSGMKPYCRVEKNGKLSQWSQDYCENVQFVQRLCRYGFQIKTYQLQFVFNFTQPFQSVYFSYSIPYTYTDLQNFISQIKSYNLPYVKISQLCESLSGISVPLIKLNQRSQKKRGKTKVAIITARIHPGQSNSSYLVEGFLRKLLSNCQQSNYLLHNYVFYIVPMLNPDGVIIGNFRTSFSGKDLNRQFNSNNKFIFPQICALKQLCQKIKSSYNSSIDIYFDFHGHSSKKNLFCYGPQHKKHSPYFYKAKALAKYIQNTNQIFSYQDSIFTISEQKKNTARAYMFRVEKIPLSFTFQISNGICENSDKIMTLLNKNIILDSGGKILIGLYQFALIQIKIPVNQIRAKVDSGKYQRRIIFDKKHLQHNQPQKINNKKNKFKKFQKENFKNQKIFEEQKVPSKKIQDILSQINFERLHKQQQHIQEQGSDSEGQSEDLSKQEEARLFNCIIKDRNIENYINFSKIIQSQKLLSVKLKQNIQSQFCRKPFSFYGKRSFPNKNFSFSTKKSKGRGQSIQKKRVTVAQKPFTLFL